MVDPDRLGGRRRGATDLEGGARAGQRVSCNGGGEPALLGGGRAAGFSLGARWVAAPVLRRGGRRPGGSVDGGDVWRGAWFRLAGREGTGLLRQTRRLCLGD